MPRARYRDGMTPRKLVSLAGLVLIGGFAIAGVVGSIRAQAEVPNWAQWGFGAGVVTMLIGALLKPRPGDVTNRR